MQNTTYTVDFFIKKFEAIPEERWCGDGAIHKWQSDQHCAFGHCGAQGAACEEGNALHNLVLDNLKNIFNGVAGINDGQVQRYQQPTPKQRILAALYDIKKMQQPQYPDIRKELAVFEIGDKTDLPVSVIIAK